MRILFLVAILFVNSTLLNAQSSKLDSINGLIENAENDSVKLAATYQKASYYRSIDSLDLAIETGYEMLDLASKLDKQSNHVWGYRVISYNYVLKSDIDKSIEILEDALATCTEKDTSSLAILYQDIGRRFSWKEMPSESLTYYFKAAPYYALIDNELGIYWSIASAYSQLNDEANATLYSLKAIAIAEEKENYNALSSLYLSQGYYYLMLIKHYESYQYSMKALDVYLNELKDSTHSGLGTVYGNIADVYIYFYKNNSDSIKIVNPSFNELTDIRQGMLDTAKYYIDKSYEVVKIKSNPNNLFYIHYGYGDLLYYQGKVKESESEFRKCYDITFENDGMIFDRKKVAEQLFKVHKKLNNNKEALAFYEEFIILKDSLYSLDEQREVGKQEALFEYEIKSAKEEAERLKEEALKQAKLDQEQAVAAEEKKKKSAIIYGIGFVLVLITLFSAYIYRKMLIGKKQKHLIESQKVVIEKNRNQMLESIEYSKNIQQRIFPTSAEMKALLPDSFIYFRPKDVVSGDFYWAFKKGTKVYFSVADCTGHGVPGAFMTIISLNLINSIMQEDVLSTGDLLLRLHHRLKDRLSTKEEESLKHGLDIALCSYDSETNELEFSGIHNPMYIINNESKMIQYKGDNLFLGVTKNFDVTTHKIKLDKGDTVYMSTDGYPDQKGGEDGKKYYYSRLRNTILEINDMEMKDRRKHLDATFENWKKGQEQIDDVCVMGVRF